MKSRVLAGLPTAVKARRRGRLRTAGMCCAAVIAVGTVGWNIPSVNTFAQDVIRSWGITINSDNVSSQQSGNYVTLNNKASHKAGKYDTIAQVEDMLGVDILESTEAYTGAKNLITYYPSVKNGELYSVGLECDIYSVGDLRNVKVDSSTDEDDEGSMRVPSISFDFGEKYSSAVKAEIAVRGIREDGTEATEFESDDFTLPDGVSAITYTPKNIDAEVVIYTMPVDDISGMDDMRIVINEYPVTFAHFVYNNVSYIYMARISEDTMKEFLDTLVTG
jgi:hypothetical protein